MIRKALIWFGIFIYVHSCQDRLWMLHNPDQGKAVRQNKLINLLILYVGNILVLTTLVVIVVHELIAHH